MGVVSEGYLSQNFKRSECACKCGLCDRFGADSELLHVLQKYRTQINQPIYVNSWYRCPVHNNRPANQRNTKSIAGAGSNSDSWHLTGGAVDFYVRGKSPVEVYQELDAEYPNQYGIGLYKAKGFVHLDIRPDKARWWE